MDSVFKLIYRCKAAWYCFCYPTKLKTPREVALEQLVRRMLTWTRYKNSKWAIEAKRVLKQ